MCVSPEESQVADTYPKRLLSALHFRDYRHCIQGAGKMWLFWGGGNHLGEGGKMLREPREPEHKIV